MAYILKLAFTQDVLDEIQAALKGKLYGYLCKLSYICTLYIEHAIQFDHP